MSHGHSAVAEPLIKHVRVRSYDTWYVGWQYGRIFVDHVWCEWFVKRGF